VKLPENFYDNLLQMMLDRLSQCLEIDIFKDILVSSWSQHPALQEYRDAEKHPPQETALVPLVEHSISASHPIALEPALMGQSLGEIEFEVEAEFLMKGTTLEVRDAKIMKVYLTSVDAGGKLALSMGSVSVPLWEKEVGTLEFPGHLDLQDGVPITELSEEKSSSETVEDWKVNS
jgi:hypothetical protein